MWWPIKGNPFPARFGMNPDRWTFRPQNTDRSKYATGPHAAARMNRLCFRDRSGSGHLSGASAFGAQDMEDPVRENPIAERRILSRADPDQLLTQLSAGTAEDWVYTPNLKEIW